MGARRQLSAAQLALLSALGGVMAAAGFLCFLPRFPHGSALFYAQLAVTLALISSGLLFSLKCGSAIENGIASGRWPEESITSLLATLKSSLLNTLSITFLFAAIFCAIAFHHRSEATFAALMLAQTIQRLQFIARTPADRRPPFDWHNGLPLRSEHWGGH